MHCGFGSVVVTTVSLSRSGSFFRCQYSLINVSRRSSFLFGFNCHNGRCSKTSLKTIFFVREPPQGLAVVYSLPILRLFSGWSPKDRSFAYDPRTFLLHSEYWLIGRQKAASRCSILFMHFYTVRLLIGGRQQTVLRFSSTHFSSRL